MSTMAATVRPRRAKFLEHFANRAACLVGMEACGGAQHWARRLRALGHEVRLLPAKISGNKNDAAVDQDQWRPVGAQINGLRGLLAKRRADGGDAAGHGGGPRAGLGAAAGGLRRSPVSAC